MKPTKATHNIEFEFGQVVCLKTDSEKRQRMVTSITLYPGSCVKYCVSCSSDEEWYYGFELEPVGKVNRPSYIQ